MRILVVAATDMEIAPLVAKLAVREGTGVEPSQARSRPVGRFTYGAHAVDVLVTGVGMVATAARCSSALAGRRYDLALNAGVCGSFDRALAPGQVVHVIADRIPELGAEDGDGFLTIQELHLIGDNDFPFTCGQLVNAAPPAIAALAALPAVHAITVNTAHGNERSIAAVTARFEPRVESMEGAAFMYACLIQGVPFAQVRAVSNYVEKRNREAWRIPLAIESLGQAAVSILKDA